MKLVHSSLEGHIIKEEIKFVEWIIESPELFSGYVQELILQCEGLEKDYVLSEGEKILDISKVTEIVLNPFKININEKKIINKLYAELHQLAYAEDMYVETQELMQSIHNYLLKLEQKSEHMLEISNIVDMSLLFKAASIQHEVMEEDYFETIVRYIKIIVRLGIKLVAFINIRSYLCDEQLISFMKDMSYQDIKILFIENVEKGCISGLYRYIIDTDRCEIF